LNEGIKRRLRVKTRPKKNEERFIFKIHEIILLGIQVFENILD
jgi:hypothetical protein